MTRAWALLALACCALAARAQAPLRDPFARPAPPAAAAPEQPRPRLRAIMFEPGHSLADVGGQIVAVGDWFGEYRVAAIGERSVTLVRRGASTVIPLDKGDGK